MTGPVNIKAERLRRGLSQEGLAIAVGISVDVIRTAEKGGRPRRPEHAVAIADFFGIDVLQQWPLDAEEAVA